MKSNTKTVTIALVASSVFSEYGSNGVFVEGYLAYQQSHTLSHPVTTTMSTTRSLKRHRFHPSRVDYDDYMQLLSSSEPLPSCNIQVDDPMNNRHSASDWLYNIRSFPRSQVLREIRNPVLSVAAWSFIVSVVHRLGTSQWASPSLRYFTSRMSISGTAHSFLVSALGLLLVFRTNSAYQRFHEGRKIWENILSISRNMSRMIQLYSNEVGEERKQRILKLVAAYPYLLRQHIRPGCLCAPPEQHIPTKYKLLLQESYTRRYLPVTRDEGEIAASATSDLLRKVSNNVSGDEYEDVCAKMCWVDRRHLPWCLFRPESLPLIAKAENRPLWVCDRMASVMMTIPYGPNFSSRERLTLLKMVDSLTNAVGQCERIHQTAVPLNYARHSLRSLTLWLFTLPFALIQDMGLFTAPVNACIAWLLFGVYQIGYSIEDPFQGSLRLSILCDAIRRNVIGQSEELRNTAFLAIPENEQDGNMIRTHKNRNSKTYVDRTYNEASINHDLRIPRLPNEDLPTHLLVDGNILNPPKFLPNQNGTHQPLDYKSG